MPIANSAATTPDAVMAPGVLRASVLIVSYNSRDHLDRCLAALARTLDAECEVVLVDNNSSDGSAGFVAEHFPWVKLIRNNSNEGFAAATNHAANAASGRYLLALNPDTEVTAGWLDALLSPLEAAKTESSPQRPIGLTTPRILLSAERDRVNTCGNSMHFTGITVCRGLGLRADDPRLTKPAEVSAVSGACFAISRALWQELGGLDEIFFTYLEDTDLSLRARLAGYRCVYVPAATVYHEYTSRFSAQKLYYLERNRLLMLVKALHWRTLLLLTPALTLLEALTWGFALKSGVGHLSAKARAYGWLLSNARRLLASRSRVQSTRRSSDRALIRGMAWHLDVRQLTSGPIAAVADKLLTTPFHLWHRVMLAALRYW